jgi:hypothetical protein
LSDFAEAVGEGEVLGDVFVEVVWVRGGVLFLSRKESCPGKRMFSFTVSI